MTYRVLVPVRIPAGGAEVLLLQQSDRSTASSEGANELEVKEQRLRNARLNVELDEHGIRQITLDGHPLLGAGGIGLHLRQDTTDTWTMNSDAYIEPVAEVLTRAQWIVEETGPLRGRVRLESWLGHSHVRWTLSLPHDKAQLEILLEVGFLD